MLFTTGRSDWPRDSCAPLWGSSLSVLREGIKGEVGIFFVCKYFPIVNNVQTDKFPWVIPTINIFAPVGFLREKAPQVCDARHGDGQKLLHNNQWLLLREDLIRQQLSILHGRIKLITNWAASGVYSSQLTPETCTAHSCRWSSVTTTYFITYKTLMSQSVCLFLHMMYCCHSWVKDKQKMQAEY